MHFTPAHPILHNMSQYFLEKSAYNVSSPWSELMLAMQLLIAGSCIAATANDLGLDDILDVAVLRSQPTGDTAIPFTTSSWLASLPSVSLTYLGSDERDGTDETELSLNLPLKSPGGRERDRELVELAGQLEATDRQRRRLYFSGLLREALWSRRLSVTRERFLARKIDLLKNLESRQRELMAAEATSLYGLLAVRQERLRAQIEQREQHRETMRWQQRYRQLTGLGSAPDDESIAEVPPPGRFDPGQHPDMQMLTLSWERSKRLFAAGAGRNTPWNIALTARQFDNPLFEENQYGVTVEIPLTFLDLVPEASRGEWRQSAQNYWRAHDELQAALDDSWQRLNSEREFLMEKQALLEEAAATGRKLVEQLEQLRTSNEIGAEIWLRRAMEAVDTQAAAAVNEVLIGQNRAMLRQAAGLPL
jgi:hypothetical protein